MGWLDNWSNTDTVVLTRPDTGIDLSNAIILYPETDIVSDSDTFSADSSDSSTLHKKIIADLDELKEDLTEDPAIQAERIVRRSNIRLRGYASILAEYVQKRSRCKWISKAVHTDYLKLKSDHKIVDEKLISEVENFYSQSEKEQVVIKLRRVDAEGEYAKLEQEGFEITVSLEDKKTIIVISGVSDRAVLFGIGRFLREIYMDYHISYTKPLIKLCYLDLDLESKENKNFSGYGFTQIDEKHFSLTSQPDFPLRQHQIAYRPKTNSYDAFTPRRMRQEIIDLAMFGTNGIEVIPPGVDDALQSPNFTIPWLDMIRFVSETCQALDLRVSIWYPAFFKSYSTPDEIQAAETHWRQIFSNLSRLDSLFVPGGDPGGHPPEEFFNIVKRQARFMRENFFPKAEAWVSSQFGLSFSVDLGMTEPWVPVVQEQNWFKELRRADVKEFLTGVVYGPWSCCPLEEFRAQVPEYFPLRNYPDLCHVQTCQLPVTTWDLSFALTNNRESINPRPQEMAAIAFQQKDFTIGCGCYSEGVNDDVNKYVWSIIHWGLDHTGYQLRGKLSVRPLDPLNKTVKEENQTFEEEDFNLSKLLTRGLRQYSKLLLEQPHQCALMTEAIYSLENDWIGDPSNVEKSIHIFDELLSNFRVRHQHNWRLSLLLFRFYHDCMVYKRLCEERDACSKAVQVLIDAMLSSAGNNIEVIAPLSILSKSISIVTAPYSEPPMAISSFSSTSIPNALNIVRLSKQPTITHLYAKVSALASALFHQIGYQLSIGYGSQHRQRGGYLDLIWAPVHDTGYLSRVFSLLGSISSVADLPNLEPQQIALLTRFVVSLVEHLREHNVQPHSDMYKHFLELYGYVSPKSLVNGTIVIPDVLFYCCFGDVEAAPLPGYNPQRSESEKIERREQLDRIMPPNSHVFPGDDPQCFSHLLTEYLDCSNDVTIRRLHAGEIPRCFRSFVLPVWPRMSSFAFHFDLKQDLKLSQRDLDVNDLLVRVTYVGKDLNRHGGDWEELNRESMPTRMKVNGRVVHSFLDPNTIEVTGTRLFIMPRSVIDRGLKTGKFIVRIEAQLGDKVTFRHVPLPVAELWILKRPRTVSEQSKL